jgi:hypothetical protein
MGGTCSTHVGGGKSMHTFRRQACRCETARELSADARLVTRRVWKSAWGG